mmetsp:Transcript_9598/g.13856  ORF Transcript_9598/g.13856 Transcript_9598/m.13856 type:complete len:170 (+) Transcript_9598:1328-1837(+)
MFKQTSTVFNQEVIVIYKDPSCVGNKALFILVNAKVDNYFRNLLTRTTGFGDKALLLLQKQCASNNMIDKNHFHFVFTNLRMLSSETATHFLRRFIIGRNQAELAGNSYDDIQLVDFLLSAMSSVTNQAYMTNLSVFQMKRDDNQAVTSQVQKLALMQPLPRHRGTSPK